MSGAVTLSNLRAICDASTARAREAHNTRRGRSPEACCQSRCRYRSVGLPSLQQTQQSGIQRRAIPSALTCLTAALQLCDVRTMQPPPTPPPPFVL